MPDCVAGDATTKAQAQTNLMPTGTPERLLSIPREGCSILQSELGAVFGRLVDDDMRMEEEHTRVHTDHADDIHVFEQCPRFSSRDCSHGVFSRNFRSGREQVQGRSSAMNTFDFLSRGG